MQRRLCFALAVLLLAFVLTGCVTAGNSSERVYNVGDVGPSGGLVFYDKGEFSDGWRYLEVAPASTEIMAGWGYEGVAIETETAVGSGASNTKMLLAQATFIAETAASYCDALTVKKTTGWYLPSKDELALVFSALGRTGKDTFLQEGFAYWSSSSFDERRSWAQGFSNAVQGRVEKSELLAVRAIRSF